MFFRGWVGWLLSVWQRDMGMHLYGRTTILIQLVAPAMMMMVQQSWSAISLEVSLDHYSQWVHTLIRGSSCLDAAAQDHQFAAFKNLKDFLWKRIGDSFAVFNTVWWCWRSGYVISNARSVNINSIRSIRWQQLRHILARNIPGTPTSLTVWYGSSLSSCCAWWSDIKAGQEWYESFAHRRDRALAANQSSWSWWRWRRSLDTFAETQWWKWWRQWP